MNDRMAIDGGVHHGGVAKQLLAGEGRNDLADDAEAGKIMMYTSG